MISILDLDRNYYPKLENKTNFDRELKLIEPIIAELAENNFFNPSFWEKLLSFVSFCIT